MSAETPSLDALRIDRSATPRSSFPWLTVLSVLLLLIVAVSGWLLKPKPIEVETAVAMEQIQGQQNAAPVQTALLNASGYITARLSSTVSSKVTGKVTEVYIEEGMHVEKDKILAALDNTNVVASLRLAEAQLLAAQKAVEEIRPNLAFAEQERKRYTELVANKAASQSDANRIDAEAAALKARLDKTSADVEVAAREVDSWKQQVEDTIIRAPFSGIVTQKNAQPGEMISPMSAGGGFTRTGICTIVDMNSLEIEVDVNESFINRVQSAQPVEAILDSYPDVKFPSKVIAIIPTADRQKATVKVRVGFEKIDPRMLPDMGVKVAFLPLPEEQKAPEKEGSRYVLIPKSAIQADNSSDIVWVLENDRASKRMVKVHQTIGVNSYISEGVVAGESVIIDPPSELSDGKRVSQKKSS